MSFLAKIFGDTNVKYLKNLQPLVGKINDAEKDYEKLSDEELKNKTNEFKKAIAEASSIESGSDAVLVEAFAVVREAAKRVLGQRHFDVQILGGIVLHQGKIAEMKTGEGKTLVATLPAYLNALTGKGVHIITVNDYLSQRDAVWMGQIYHFLGLKVGCLNHEVSYLYDPLYTENQNFPPKADSPQVKKLKTETNNLELKTDNQNGLDKTRDILGGFKIVHEFLRPCTRREAYEADITYGTNNEFGFDYLRDNMAYPVRRNFSGGEYAPAQVVQRGFNYAVIDEVDSVLIDEARTPLIISAPDAQSEELYYSFSKIVPRLQEGNDYNVDEKMKAVAITEDGIDRVEKLLGVKDIYTEKGIRYVHHLEQALKARVLFQKDRDYVVKDGEIVIVDEFTGRLMPGRRWSEGLHQAIEAKEGLKVQRESRTLATITFQNYFRMYAKLAGMTGTAQTSAEEFFKVYGIDVIVAPTNKPMIRKDHPDRIFQTENGKFQAIVREIKERHQKGQPVLVGTISIEKNEFLGAFLKKEGVPHNLLNAKNHEKEAEIIAQAGKKGAVTIATNMAGRGVDIVLGGNPPLLDEADEVREVGGLFVLGTERHEARRIDNQLRGRSGRQGDPGETQFFVSLEDDLMRVFGSDKLKNMMGRFGIPEDEPIEHGFISKAIESAQAKIEGMNFDLRKHILEYDDVMNRQRNAIYAKRKKILFDEKEDIARFAAEVIQKEADGIIDFHTQAGIDSWNMEEIAENFQANFGNIDNLHQALSSFIKKNADEGAVREEIREFLHSIWRKGFEVRTVKEADYPDLLKMLVLQTIDTLWIDHLEMMDHLRSSVRLRAYGQRDPLAEYKNEGVRLFRELESLIGAQIARLALRVSGQPRAEVERGREIHDSARILGNNSAVSSEPRQSGSGARPSQKVGRNDPCLCGSGKKYKRCHGA